MHRQLFRATQHRFLHASPARFLASSSLQRMQSGQEIVVDSNPLPIRPEFTKSDKKLTSADLENIQIQQGKHFKPENIGDYIALGIVKALRIPADWFFQKKYIHRAITLETVAAVPGFVAGTVRHLNSLRKMKPDGGWINHLLHEGENERMHLMIWMKATDPNLLERFLVAGVQFVFYNLYFLGYLFFPRIAHRMVGYLEEEAIISYNGFLSEIDKGNIKNIPAPKLAIEYYNLGEDATLRDVVLAVRADEATHRDVNHHFADRILARQEDLRAPIKSDT